MINTGKLLEEIARLNAVNRELLEALEATLLILTTATFYGDDTYERGRIRAAADKARAAITKAKSDA
jgi:hypothetical protein